MGLVHYLAARDGRRLPRFLQARRLPAPPGEDPWARHAAAVRELRVRSPFSAAGAADAAHSILDLKITLADAMLQACDLCPQHCLVDRRSGVVGYCGVGAATAVHWEGILHGEELEVVPSHEVFLSGCTMRCAFCYSHEHITRPMSGVLVTPSELAASTTHRRAQGAVNLNLVGGEPIVHLPNILRALRELDAPVPIVWNSNMYATKRTMELLDGVVDLFLGDIHFGSEECASRLGRIPDYLPAVKESFAAASASGASVIIRHLVMPGHLECCARPAMEWAASALSEVPFHLMLQYIPDYRAEGDPILGRPLSSEERVRVRGIAREIGVLLYQEPTGKPGQQEGTQGTVQKVDRHAGLDGAHTEAGAWNGSPGVGDTVDILVHGDGRVSFHRLVDELVPVAAALNEHDERISRRGER